MTIGDVLAQFSFSMPALLFWIAVIIFGAIMLGRGGGRAERFLIIGASTKIFAVIHAGILPHILFNAMENPDEIISVFHWTQIFTSVVHAVGIACLIYAFWVKFCGKMDNQANMALPEN